MASAQDADSIILVGNDSLVAKRLIACVNALWLYDYFLTLADEIEWAWSGRKSLVFALFFLVLANLVPTLVIRGVLVAWIYETCDQPPPSRFGTFLTSLLIPRCAFLHLGTRSTSIVYTPNLQVRQHRVLFCFLLYARHVVRPGSHHLEVRNRSELSHKNLSSPTGYTL
ncbi:hypothetical protein BJ322DRAFT_151231 [Thelephora terrestris]|uniref:DUF6533 domain-containing protein n=1 Tax=Thelephora terrestris TaxID=56493 RepID=A0A9P6HB85_9AGAM|nr:hypothetical protein BJ322DRAFT_151231 [Thelephora terrestris]